MTDQQILVALRNVLLPLVDRRLPMVGPIDLRQNYQPTQQGAATTPTFYMHKLSHRRYGHPGRRYVYDAAGQVLRLTQAQAIVARYQFNATLRQAKDSAAVTASDMLDALAGVLNGDTALEQLRAQYGLGVERVMDLTNPYTPNERGQFEAEPSFDVVLTFSRAVTEDTPSTASIEYGIYRT